MNEINTLKKFYMRNPLICLFASILFINTCLCSSAVGQKEFGFKMPEKVSKIEIPFEQYNNLIVIPVTINRFLTLKFILDTGVETAILTEKIYGDILNLKYIREIIIDGPGIIDSIEAIIANEVTFSLPGGITGYNMNLLVLKEDYLELSSNIGDNVHGIIGYDIFSRFVVEVDYDDNIITLWDPLKYKKKRRSIEVPTKIVNNKPFISAKIDQGKKEKFLDIMIDTGASHAALIDYSIFDPTMMPKEHIAVRLGRGISGEIPGFVGRMDSLTISGFNFRDVLVSTPLEGAYNNSIKRGSRVGTLGGDVLKRFNITFDYNSEKIYLIKSDFFRENFEYNMSGMTINAVGEKLDSIKVVDLEIGGAAASVDIRVGDVILKVNGKHLRNSSLSKIYSLMRKSDGYKIKCTILRDGEKIKKKFYLKRMI
jgi:hypothetical protein